MINHVEVEGTLVKEPVSRVAGQATVISFSIAQNTRKKDAGGQWVDGDPFFFDVEYWPSDPQFWLQRLTKGTSVVVTGELRQDRWTDQTTGQTRSAVKIRATDVTSKWIPTVEWQNKMKADRGTAHAQSEPAQQAQPTVQAQPVADANDIPF